MSRLHPTDAERRQDALNDAVTGLFEAMDLHPEYQPCRNAPPAFAAALVRLENAYIEWFAYTARTAPRAERVAQEAVR